MPGRCPPADLVAQVDVLVLRTSSASGSRRILHLDPKTLAIPARLNPFASSIQIGAIPGVAAAVVADLTLAAALAWDDRRDARRPQVGAQSVGVVAFVGGQPGSRASGSPG